MSWMLASVPWQANAAATSLLVGLVADATILTTASGKIQTGGPLVAGATATWDAITGDVGGLVFNALYYIDPTTPGHLTRTPTVVGGQLQAPVGQGFDTLTMIILRGATILE